MQLIHLFAYLGPTLHRSLYTLMDVSRKMSSPMLCAVAPFRSSKLTHYLSELLGGNAIVVALGLVCSGESAFTRKTLELMGSLTSARFVRDSLLPCHMVLTHLTAGTIRLLGKK